MASLAKVFLTQVQRFENQLRLKAPQVIIKAEELLASQSERHARDEAGLSSQVLFHFQESCILKHNDWVAEHPTHESHIFFLDTSFMETLDPEVYRKAINVAGTT